jgi:hypothetical protein
MAEGPPAGTDTLGWVMVMVPPLGVYTWLSLLHLFYLSSCLVDFVPWIETMMTRVPSSSHILELGGNSRDVAIVSTDPTPVPAKREDRDGFSSIPLGGTFATGLTHSTHRLVTTTSYCRRLCVRAFVLKPTTIKKQYHDFHAN